MSPGCGGKIPGRVRGEKTIPLKKRKNKKERRKLDEKKKDFAEKRQQGGKFARLVSSALGRERLRSKEVPEEGKGPRSMYMGGVEKVQRALVKAAFRNLPGLGGPRGGKWGGGLRENLEGLGRKI